MCTAVCARLRETRLARVAMRSEARDGARERGITERVVCHHLLPHTAAQYSTKLRYATHNARIRGGVTRRRFANFAPL